MHALRYRIANRIAQPYSATVYGFRAFSDKRALNWKIINIYLRPKINWNSLNSIEIVSTQYVLSIQGENICFNVKWFRANKGVEIETSVLKNIFKKAKIGLFMNFAIEFEIW